MLPSGLPAALKPLQWGRNLIVAEGREWPVGGYWVTVLQWGRNLIVAEGALSLRQTSDRCKASMGPQLDSCGRLTAPPFFKTLIWLQWGRNLIVAEGFKKVALCLALTELQWGRNLIVAEGADRALYGHDFEASMGPQLDSCGRPAVLVPMLEGLTASMGPQLDSCGRACRRLSSAMHGRLQWGRNLIVAEGGSRSGIARQMSASMGPQLDSCGRFCLRRWPYWGQRFNGAAT